MSDSPTGRGFTQGSNSYRADDVARMEREDNHAAQKKRMEQLARPLSCTCQDSSFGMDVDRCPVHGEGCA